MSESSKALVTFRQKIAQEFSEKGIIPPVVGSDRELELFKLGLEGKKKLHDKEV